MKDMDNNTVAMHHPQYICVRSISHDLKLAPADLEKVQNLVQDLLGQLGVNLKVETLTGTASGQEFQGLLCSGKTY